jgi:hypothetical protein
LILKHLCRAIRDFPPSNRIGKLVLAKQTVRALQTGALSRAAGGMAGNWNGRPISWDNVNTCNTCYYGCNTDGDACKLSAGLPC